MPPAAAIATWCSSRHPSPPSSMGSACCACCATNSFTCLTVCFRHYSFDSGIANKLMSQCLIISNLCFTTLAEKFLLLCVAACLSGNADLFVWHNCSSGQGKSTQQTITLVRHGVLVRIQLPRAEELCHHLLHCLSVLPTLRVELTACAGGLQTWNPSCWLSSVALGDCC